jgi:pimeloyl-ACP methyl ester carboxylesterase
MSRSGNGPIALRLTWIAVRVAGVFSTRWAGRLAARLWFTPWRIPLSEQVRNRRGGWLKDATELTIDVDGRRLSGFAAGAGPTVLLVHGWADRAAGLGAFVRPLTSAGYRVVGVDLPGHGESAGGKTDGFELSSALHEIAHRLGPIHSVVAHSMGAQVTTFALAEGLDLGSAVLIAPSVRLEQALDRFGAKLRLPQNATQGLRREIERRFGESVWHDFAGDTLARLIKLPTLIFHDAGDAEVPLSDAKMLAEAWSDAELVTPEGLGHTRILRDEAVIERAVSFIRHAAFSDPSSRQSSLAG